MMMGWPVRLVNLLPVSLLIRSPCRGLAVDACPAAGGELEHLALGGQGGVARGGHSDAVGGCELGRKPAGCQGICLG